jgi:F-type H+-transporting ATPase subunit b
MRARLEHGRSGLHGGTRTKGREKRTERGLIACLISGLITALFALTAAHASGGGESGSHEGPNWLNFFWRSVNFLALAGACYWLLAKKMREFFTGRREGIRSALAEAVTARRAAQKQFEDYSAKLDKATGEIDQIGEMIKSQGLAEKARIIDDARKVSEKMKEETRTRMEQEFNKASRQLRIEAVRLSATMAEELLRKHIRPADHEAMVEDTIEKVVSKH